MSSEFQSRNAWFIYTLTFLLTLAVFFILLLILIKCVQLCVEMKRMLWKKFKRRQRRRRRRARRRRERNQQTMANSSDLPVTRSSSCEDSSSSYSSSTSYSSSSSSSSYDSSSHSSSSSSEDEALTSPPPHFQVNSSSSCHDNFAFQPDLVAKNECNKNNKNVINRKYDCKSRFASKCASNEKENNEKCEEKCEEKVIQTISSQVEEQIAKNLSCTRAIQIDSTLSAFDLNQIVILSNEMNRCEQFVSLQNAFPSPPPFNSIIPHTTGGILFSSSADSCSIHHIPQLTYLTTTKTTNNQVNRNFFDLTTSSPLLLNKKCSDDLQSVKISLEDDEIPPSYDQVIKESRV